MTFTITKLVGHRALVAGTDRNNVTNQTVVDTAQWESLSENKELKAAQEAFDAAVTAHFADITAAAERVASVAKGDADPLTYIVSQEAVEGVAGQPERRVQLSHDSQVLRAVESGQHDRLVWVGDSLEIAAEAVPGPSVGVGGGSAVDAGTPSENLGGLTG